MKLEEKIVPVFEAQSFVKQRRFFIIVLVNYVDIMYN